MSKRLYSIDAPDQARLKIARTEIEAVLKKHDLGGVELRDARPLPFIPWRGELGFFDIPSTPQLEADLRGITPAQAEAIGQNRLFT